jgi:hypothetical protein
MTHQPQSLKELHLEFKKQREKHNKLSAEQRESETGIAIYQQMQDTHQNLIACIKAFKV